MKTSGYGYMFRSPFHYEISHSICSEEENYQTNWEFLDSYFLHGEKNHTALYISKFCGQNL